MIRLKNKKYIHRFTIILLILVPSIAALASLNLPIQTTDNTNIDILAGPEKSSLNVDYNEYLNFYTQMPLYSDIFVPNYIETSQLAPWSSIRFRLYKPDFVNNNPFRNFQIIYNDKVIFGPIAPTDTVDFQIFSVSDLNSTGVYHLTAKAFNVLDGKWVSKDITVNITDDRTSFYPFYDDIIFNYQGYNNGYIQWQLYSPNPDIDVKLLINGTEYLSGKYYSGDVISYDLNNLGISTESTWVGRFIVNDSYSGVVTENHFTITAISEDVAPYMSNYGLSVYSFTLGESFPKDLIHVAAQASETKDPYLPSRIDVYIAEPGSQQVIVKYCEILNITPGVTYDVPFYYDKFDKALDYYGHNVDRASFQIVYVPMTKYGVGRSPTSTNSYNTIDVYTNRAMQYADYETMYIDWGNLNLTTMEISDDVGMGADNPTYSLTIVAESTSSTWLSFYAMTGRQFSWNTDNCYYGRVECELFREKYINHDTVKMGFVFWVIPYNASAINYPIIVRVEYPEELEPDDVLGEPPLRLLHFARTPLGDHWELMPQTSIRNISLYVKELRIDKPGLYAFGMDAADYEDEILSGGGPGVPGFPIMPFLMCSSIGIALIVLKMRKIRN